MPLLDISKPTERIIALSLAVGLLIFFNFSRRKCSTFLKRRRLAEKIARFRDQEKSRRDAIKARLAADRSSNHSAVTSLSFHEITAKLNKGELTAVQVLRAYQDAALKATDATNCVTEFVEDADKKAVELDRKTSTNRLPLHGVPFSVKECLFLEGTEATAGYSQYLGVCNKSGTAPIVKWLQDLGAIPFCKTNIPQSLYSFDSRNAIYGMVTNPVDSSRGPGGSSSGEGAIVAAKASLIGIGTDIGGSSRVPAAWCGCYSLKPSSKRTLIGGDVLLKYQLRVISQDFYAPGFFTQDVDTMVKLCRLLWSRQTFERFPISSLSPVAFQEDLMEPSKKLTIGYCDFDGVLELVPAVKRALKLAKERLEKCGHRLVPWTGISPREGYLIYIRSLTVEGLPDLIRDLENDIDVCFPMQIYYDFARIPNWAKRLMKPFVRWFAGPLLRDLYPCFISGTEPQDVNKIFREICCYREAFGHDFTEAKLDALLWPPMPCPALPVDKPREVGPALSYLTLFNLLDWPAGICPIDKVRQEDEDLMTAYPGYYERDMNHAVIKTGTSTGTIGLPLAVQIAAPKFHEETILRLMKDLA